MKRLVPLAEVKPASSSSVTYLRGLSREKEHLEAEGSQEMLARGQRNVLVGSTWSFLGRWGPQRKKRKQGWL